MLGSPEDPQIKVLMDMIETQSKATLAEWKPLLKEARQIAKEAQGKPAAAYNQVGLSENQACYDALAAHEFIKMAESPGQVMIPNETEPVKIDWFC